MDMQMTITRAEHAEFKKRLEEKNDRQDKRLSLLEQQVEELKKTAVSIERLSNIMESMLREQKSQGEHLQKLESLDGEMWRKVVGYIATAIIGIVIGFIFKQIGM
ncbi:hypothetical protein [Amedibacillus dolichus]|uniref:hypothetical protein n=1 Tax=Amedibacillus dolichus TaxID=31971 RepID=UPI00243198AA|nr:hypothetical protein [Amedibacillus dolichus]